MHLSTSQRYDKTECKWLKEYNQDYDKAIDDFVKFASDMSIVEENGEKRPMWLEEMAEQLKRR